MLSQSPFAPRFLSRRAAASSPASVVPEVLFFTGSVYGFLVLSFSLSLSRSYFSPFSFSLFLSLLPLFSFSLSLSLSLSLPVLLASLLNLALLSSTLSSFILFSPFFPPPSLSLSSACFFFRFCLCSGKKKFKVYSLRYDRYAWTVGFRNFLPDRPSNYRQTDPRIEILRKKLSDFRKSLHVQSRVLDKCNF